MTASSISQIDFTTFLNSLPADGETALYVRQKPKLIDGVQAVHNDGTPQYTWPAFLPSDKELKGSWYGNTASFILERMTGRPSAAAANCDFVLVMVLDDIGTKSSVPTIEPT